MNLCTIGNIEWCHRCHFNMALDIYQGTGNAGNKKDSAWEQRKLMGCNWLLTESTTHECKPRHMPDGCWSSDIPRWRSENSENNCILVRKIQWHTKKLSCTWKRTVNNNRNPEKIQTPTFGYQVLCLHRPQTIGIPINPKESIIQIIKVEWHYEWLRLQNNLHTWKR